jgi:hypothetical protein
VPHFSHESLMENEVPQEVKKLHPKNQLAISDAM